MTSRFLDECRLSDISEVQTGPFGSQLHASAYKDEGTPIITVEHLGDNEILHQNLPLVGERDRARLEKYSLRIGDIVFSRVGAIDRRAYVSDKESGWLFSGRLLRVRPAPSKAGSKFLSHLLGHHLPVQWIRSHAVGSTMPCLNTSILSAIPLRLPARSEQRKIAEILDTIDEAIRTTEQLIAKLEQVKQGLLHDLLTRGIDDNGELRDPVRHPEQFKDSVLGRIPRGWEACELGQLVDPRRPIVYGILMPGQGHPNGVPVVKVKDIVAGEIKLGNLLLTSPEIDHEYRRSRLAAGDLLFTIRGTVGRKAFVPSYLHDANITQDTARIAIRGLNPVFVHEYLDMPIPRRFIETHTIGVAVRGINLRDVRRIPMVKPTNREADDIAGRLGVADAQISAGRAEVSKLRLLKQGLMDDLLTGRVRVTHLLEEPPE